MRRIAHPRSDVQQSKPLRRSEPHFRGELPGLFTAVEKILRQLLIEEYHCVAERHSVLRSAKTKDIYAAFPRHRPWFHAESGHGVGEARTVHVHEQPQVVRGL